MKKKILFIYYSLLFLCVLIVTLSSSKSYAQKIKVDAVVDSSGYRIGDWIQVHISIAHPYNTTIRWSQPDSLSENFQKLAETKIDTIKQNSFLTENRTLTITTFDTGALLIPSFNFFYEDENHKVNSISSNALMVQISTVRVDTLKAFKGIKPNLIVTTEQKKKQSRLILIILANIILISATAFYFFRRRKRNVIKTTVIKVSASTTLEKLKQLEKENLQQTNTELYYVKLTLILREYIESKFDVAAFEYTTDKIILYLKEKIKEPNILERLARDFQLADLVKFAKVNPSADENKNAMNTAMEFVTKTQTQEKDASNNAI